MKIMNTIQTDVIIVLAILLLVAIAIIVADRIKYRKYYSSNGKMVVLRINKDRSKRSPQLRWFNSLPVCLLYNTQVSLHHRR